MKRTIVPLLLFVFIIGVLDLNGQTRFDKKYKQKQAQLYKSWPKPSEISYDEGELGYELQPYFKKHCKDCGFELKGKLNPKGNYIPKNFLDSIELKKDVETLPVGGEYALFYLFKKEETEKSLNNFDVRGIQFVNPNNIPNFDIKPTRGIKNSYISKSCSGYFNSKVDASTKPPVAVVEAAVSAETDMKRNGTIIAIKGDFMSPLTRLIKLKSQEGIEIHSFLWDYYKEYSDYIDNAYYLNDYQGVIIKRFSEQSSKLLFQGNANLGFSGVAQISANISAKSEIRNLYRSEDWATLITSDFTTPEKRASHFKQAPTIKEIQNYFLNLNIKGKPSAKDELFAEGKKHIVEFFIPGLLDVMSQDYWELKSYDTAIYSSSSPPEVISCEVSNQNGISGCLIKIEGLPNNSVFQEKKLKVSSEFILEGVIEDKLNNERLLMTCEVDISTNFNPSVFYEKYSRDWKAIPADKGNLDEIRLQWQIVLKIDDDNNEVDFSKFETLIGDLAINSQSSDIDNLGFKASGKLFENDKTCVVTIETINRFKRDYFDTKLKDLKYSGNAIVCLPLESKNKAQKPITFKLRFPRKKEVPEIKIEEQVSTLLENNG